MVHPHDQPNRDSLSRNTIPTWYDDAKTGVPIPWEPLKRAQPYTLREGLV
jgi:hypothetical protein